MIGRDQLQAAADCILESEPDILVRLRLRRVVLKIPATDLAADQQILDANPWVTQLSAEQRADGGWGRFHSRDSKSRYKILTTEMGVGRGLALGLEITHPLFCRTGDYLARLLQGSLDFPDPSERNNRWPVGKQLFTAATLAGLKPHHPFIDPAFALWTEIAARAFSCGTYDPEAEDQAHAELTGASIRNSYLVLNNKYALTLLSARPDDLPAGLAARILDWVWKCGEGVRYLGVPAWLPPSGKSPSAIDRWFSTQELLARFPGWQELSRPLIEWLWEQRNPDGLWDFGPGLSSAWYWPLSARRSRLARGHDHSLRVLALIANATTPPETNLTA